MIFSLKNNVKHLFLFFSMALAYILLTANTPLLDNRDQRSSASASEDSRQNRQMESIADVPQVAYVTTHESQELLPINLVSGESEKALSLNFNAKVIAFSTDGKEVYLANTDLGHLVKIDLNTKEKHIISAPEGVPNHLAISSNRQRGFAIYEGNSDLICLDFQKKDFFPLVSFHETPNSLAFDAINNQLFVSFKRSNEIAVVDINSATVKPFVTLNSYPDNLEISRDGKRIFAAQQESYGIVVVDISSKTFQTVECNAPHFFSSEMDGETIVANGQDESLYLARERETEILNFNLKTHKLESVVNLPSPIRSIKFIPQPELLVSFKVSEAIVGTLAHFDASSTTSLREGKINYEWDFGDGLKLLSKEPFIEHIYETSGQYVATLTAVQEVVFDPSADVDMNQQVTKELVGTTKGIISVLPNEMSEDATNSFFSKPILEKKPKLGNITTTTALTSSINPSVLGQSTTLTATVTSSGIPTGMITFYDGSTSIGTGTLDGSGISTLPISNLSVGTHSITAVYGGDSTYSTSTSPILNQVVNQGATTIAVASSVNPTTYGQPTILTATLTVTAPAVGTPTGTVIFKDGATTLGTQTVSGGIAMLSVSNLSAGTHSNITAVYNGDTNFATSTSPALTPAQVVNQATPTITLSSSLNPSTYASVVTFTATVTATTTFGLPSGTVTFYDGATPIGTGTLSGSGNSSRATFSLNTLFGGSHTITAVYGGDVNFITVTSSPLIQNVTDATTTTSIISLSQSPTEYGQEIIMEAIIRGSVSSPPLPPSGTVNFYSDATLLGSALISTTINANTVSATFTYTGPPYLNLVTHQLQAIYLGDQNYTGSMSSLLPHSVVATTTSSVTVSSINPTVYGETVTFTTTVSANAPGAGQPTGNVEFYDEALSLGTATLAGVPNTNTSTATFTVPTVLSVGSHTINTVYTGDLVNGNYTSSVAAPIVQVVNQDPSTTTLVSSSPNSNYGDSITLTATVLANTPGSGTPTGTVTFKDGTTTIGTGTLVGGVATLNICNLLPGISGSTLKHHLTATYSGDVNFIASNSNTVNQNVSTKLGTVTTIVSSDENPVAVSVMGGFTDPVVFNATVVANSSCPIVPVDGTVTFYDGGTAIGTGTIVNGVVSSPSVNFYTIGHHTITAVYNGDSTNGYFAGSISPNFDQCVVPSETETTLTISPNHSEQSNAILIATVTANPVGPGFEIGGGTITFYANGNPLPGGINVPVPNSGIVQFPLPGPTLCFGCQQIYTVYSGDCTYYDMSTSNTVGQQVQQTDMLTTQTVVAQDSTTSYFCVPVTFTATVTQIVSDCNPTPQGFCPPSGSVTFFDGTTSIGTATVNEGIATLEVGTLSLGSHSISATYNSDSNFAFSVSTAITHTVIVNPTTTALFLIPALSITPYGESITFVASISSSSGDIPTGSVTFSNESGVFATVQLNSNGQAIYTTELIDAGSHTFSAIYDPDCCGITTACFEASTSSSVSHTITRALPDLGLTASPSPANYGEMIILNATVQPYAGGTPTGTVTFYNGTMLLGTAPIVDGIASLAVSDYSAGVNIPAGTATFNATYNGDTDFLPAQFPSVLVKINKLTPAVSLVSQSPNPSVIGETVNLSAYVSSLISVPTGSVTFFNGSSSLGTATLDASGIAHLNVSNLSIGSHTITATYNGDNNFLTNTSQSISQSVIKDNTITTVTSTGAITFGSTATFNVTVAAVVPGAGTPTGTVNASFGSTSLGSATLSGGIASFSTSVLPVGTSTITVVYSGDTNFIASTGFVTKTVNAATTTATISLPTTPSVFGQSVTLNGQVTSSAGTPAGTVSFKEGTTTLGTATVDGSGNASITLVNLSVGSHSLTLVYGGGGNFAASTSSPGTQVVNQANTMTTLATSVDTTSYGQAMTFTANVIPTSPGAGTPSGNVIFYDNATVIGTVGLGIGGVATFTTSSLSTGTHGNITAVYVGDGNFTTSTSNTLTQNVQPAATITTVVSLNNPSNLGSAYSLDVTVHSVDTGVVVPTGTVTAYYDGTAISGAIALDVNGKASIPLTAAPPAGPYPVVVQYTPNSSPQNFAPSTGALDQIISKTATSISLGSSINPSVFGQAVTFTATVTASSITPTGTISFFDGASLLGIQTLSAGSASFITSSLVVGTHPITAVYNGDTNFSTATSSIVNQVVNQATTGVVLNSSINPSQVGQTTLLTATVNVTSGSGSPTGTITFKDGATILGNVPVVNGMASLPWSFSTPGAHPLTAVYSGDVNFAGMSGSLNQQVNQAGTVTTVATAPNPSQFGQSVSLTATITLPVGSGTPTGTVQFKEGNSPIGSPVTVINGVAELNTSSLTVGTHSITAVYSGDTNFVSSTSQPVIQVVNTASTSLALTSNVNPSVYGQSITLTATLASASPKQTGTVTFMEGSDILGTGTVNPSGIATLNISTLSVDLHLLTATYSGDSNYSTATSPEYSQIVNQGATTTSIASSLNPSTFGQSVTITATVAINSPAVGTLTGGSVDFIENGEVIGTGILSAGNTASFSTSALMVGTHPIIATYRGDANFQVSSSVTLSQVVNQAITTTTIASINPNPSIFGDVVTFVATTTSFPGAELTGFVQFYDDATPLGSPVPTNGTAVFATNLLSVNTHPITAKYLGNANYLPSTSTPPIALKVLSQQYSYTSITTLTSDNNPQTYGCQVTFDVAVVSKVMPPPGGVPTGVVTIYEGSLPLATVALDASGKASFSTIALSAGKLEIVALYSGDTNYSSSTTTLLQQVNPLNTNLMLTSSLNPSGSQQPVTFNAIVSATDCLSMPILPTGTVSFYEGAILLDTFPLDGNGVATFTTDELTTGTHNINAIYNPDPNFKTSQDALSQLVTCIPTQTAILTAAPNPSMLGNVITFFASVSSNGGVPDGSVIFKDNGVQIPGGSITLSNGNAILSTSSLGVGTHAITVVYSGSTNYCASDSTSTPYTVVVNLPILPTITTLTSSLNPAEFGENVLFTATVSDPSHFGIPTGTVTFFDGSVAIGTSLLVNGVAQIATSSLSIGDHPITAIYSGDEDYLPSTSEIYIEKIIRSTIPQPPTHFYGCQVINKYLNFDEIVNILTWTPPQNDNTVVCYEIYRDAALKDLVGSIKNQCPYRFEDGNRKKKRTYSYYIVSVNAQGKKSPAIATKVIPYHKPKDE